MRENAQFSFDIKTPNFSYPFNTTWSSLLLTLGLCLVHNLLKTPKFTSISIFRASIFTICKKGWNSSIFLFISSLAPLFCRIPKLGLQREFSGGLKPSAAAQITCWPSTAPQYRWLGRPAGLLRGEGSACSPVAVEVVVILSSENSVGTRKNFNVDWPVGSSRAPKSPTRALVQRAKRRRREKRQTPGHHNNKSPAQF